MNSLRYLVIGTTIFYVEHLESLLTELILKYSFLIIPETSLYESEQNLFFYNALVETL